MKRSTHSLRSLLALVIALVMFAALFAGCTKSPAEEPQNTVPADTTAQTDAPTDAPTEPPTEAPTEAPTEPAATEAPVTTGTVNADNLNVRTEPDTTASILKRLPINSTVEILEQKIIDGVNWGRIAEGWINLNYVTLNGGNTGNTGNAGNTGNTGNTGSDNNNNIDKNPVADGANATVTAEGLNIRKSADADSDKVGSYSKGDRITVLEKSGSWGRTDKGWVNLKYVTLDSSVPDSSTGSNNGTSTETGKDSTVVSDGKKTILGYGTVVDTTSLAVRTGPGTKYEMVTYLRAGDKVAYYQKSGNWVRMNKGWVSVNYLQLESTIAVGSKGTVTTDLNIREEASSSSKDIGDYKKGDEVTILEVKGNWGRTDKGWISLNYVSFKSDTTSTTYKPGKYIVNTFSVNIREKASASSKDLGNYYEGDKITITEVDGNWGKTDKGWVSMKYLKADTTVTYTTGKYIVTASSLNIRKSADASSTKVGTYQKDDKVEITEVKGNWGKTDKGWVNMQYLKADTGSSESTTTYEPGKYIVTAATLNVRKTASSSATKVGEYAKGDKVTITKVDGNWGYTGAGWVSMKYLKADTTTETKDPTEPTEAATEPTEAATEPTEETKAPESGSTT